MSKARWVVLAAATALAVLTVASGSGCDLLSQAQSSKVLAATVIATPEKDFSAAIAAFDAGLPPDAGGALPDGGFFDASVPKLPSQTIAEVFFGERDPANPSSKPSGVAGAQVKLTIGGKAFTLSDKGGGTYSLTSLEDATLLYVPDVEYKIEVVQGGESFTATLQGPKPERIAQFNTGDPRPIAVSASQNLQLTRESTENVAFTTVFPLSQSGKGEPTWTDAPTSVLDLIDLVANDAQWKQKVITVPGAQAFKTANTTYLVSVASVERGTVSNNLFLGSAFVAGSSDLGLAQTP